jgi:putative ABC transport system permease protein
MLNDFRYAFRQLIKSPGFSLLAIVTLALGIGANSAIFSVIETVLLRSLPFPNADRLTMVWSSAPQHPGDNRQVHSYPDYADLRTRNHTFSALAAFTTTSVIWGSGDHAEDVSGIAATSDLFDALGTQPMVGRGFSRAEDEQGAPVTVLIGFDFWQRHYGGDANVIGKETLIQGRNGTIIGVMPRGWKFPIQHENVDFVVSLVPFISSSSQNLIPRRGAHFLSIVGSLKPGVDLRTANADLQTIAGQLAQQYPDNDAGRSEHVVPLQADVVGDVRPALLILSAAVALVLLIACANVANLFLARAASREHEIAIRTALGATRFQIVRQLLIETLLLALIGGAAGLILGSWTIDLLRANGPADLPRLDQLHINGTVVAFTFSVAALTSLVFGLVPALQASRPEVENALKDAGRGSSAVRGNRLRSAFVVAQVALSLVLLVGAGLLIRSFAQMRAVQPGFEPKGVTAFWQSLPKTHYGEPEKKTQFFDQLLPKLAAIPGVQEVGMVSPLPFSGDTSSRTFTIVGREAPAAGMEPAAAILLTNGNYFRTMRIPLLKGRTFNDRDRADSPRVMMINQSFAEKFFGKDNPLGQRLNIGNDLEKKLPPREIIGVVGSTKHASLAEPETPEFYIPFAQEPDSFTEIVLRTGSPVPVGLETAIRRLVHEIDSQQFVPSARPLTKLIGQTLAQIRFNTALLGAFGAIAILLAAVGIYGVIAYNVTQRTREIGIRMALGAQKRQMLAMILRQSLTMAAIGISIGLAGALAATRLLGALLFGVAATDLLTYGGVILLLAIAAFFAGLLPARRAMRVDPVVALRYE